MGEGLAGKGGQRKHYQTYQCLVPEVKYMLGTSSKNKTVMVRIMVCYPFHFEKNKCWHPTHYAIFYISSKLH